MGGLDNFFQSQHDAGLHWDNWFELSSETFEAITTLQAQLSASIRQSLGEQLHTQHLSGLDTAFTALAAMPITDSTLKTLCLARINVLYYNARLVLTPPKPGGKLLKANQNLWQDITSRLIDAWLNTESKASFREFLRQSLLLRASLATQFSRVIHPEIIAQQLQRSLSAIRGVTVTECELTLAPQSHPVDVWQQQSLLASYHSILKSLESKSAVLVELVDQPQRVPNSEDFYIVVAHKNEEQGLDSFLLYSLDRQIMETWSIQWQPRFLATISDASQASVYGWHLWSHGTLNSTDKSLAKLPCKGFWNHLRNNACYRMLLRCWMAFKRPRDF